MTNTVGSIRDKHHQMNYPQHENNPVGTKQYVACSKGICGGRELDSPIQPDSFFLDRFFFVIRPTCSVLLIQDGSLITRNVKHILT